MSIAMLGQFFLSLSLLIVLHECGHFFPAKWFKTRVEKFYMFFDPYFSLFKKKIGDTEYGIGWLPLGGYVKISGMVDESMDTEQMKLPPQPWEFRSKKAWQRLIIMLGGVTVNFILGFLIFGLMIWHYGEEYIPAENAKYGIFADSMGMKLGLQTGDKILKVGDKTFEKFDDRKVLKELVFNGVNNIQVERNGQPLMITIPNESIQMLTAFKNKEESIFSLPVFFTVDSILAEIPEKAKGGFLSGCKKPGTTPSPAALAKLQKGDNIIAVNSKPIKFYNEFQQIAHSNKGVPMAMTVLRGADTLQLTATPTDEGRLGFMADFKKDKYFDTKTQTYSLAQALPMGVAKGMDFLSSQIKAFGKMFKGEIKASESVGGFKSIAKMFSLEWDWERFWLMTASLSIILAFMNLLPIPALDGGYVVFLLWEVITGRRVSDAFMEKAVTAGFFLLMGLIVVINAWDIIR
jgi:regulator of sigma E protease